MHKKIYFIAGISLLVLVIGFGYLVLINKYPELINVTTITTSGNAYVPPKNFDKERPEYEAELTNFLTRYLEYFKINDQIVIMETENRRFGIYSQVGLRNGSMFYFSYNSDAIKKLADTHNESIVDYFSSPKYPTAKFYWGGGDQCLENNNECAPYGSSCINALGANMNPTDISKYFGCKCVTDAQNVINEKNYSLNVCRIDFSTSFGESNSNLVIKINSPKEIPNVRIYNNLPWTQGSGCYFDKIINISAGESVIDSGCPYYGTSPCYNFALGNDIFYNERRECLGNY